MTAAAGGVSSTSRSDEGIPGDVAGDVGPRRLDRRGIIEYERMTIISAVGSGLVGSNKGT